MRANFKAVIHFLRMQVLEVLCNCIVPHTEVRGTVPVTSLASFASDVVDGGELHIGGGRDAGDHRRRRCIAGTHAASGHAR